MPPKRRAAEVCSLKSEAFIVHHQLVEADRAQRLALVLHGVFGSGGNWRSFVQRLADERPDWGFVLVDLRGHGQSQVAPAPHDLDSVSDDLVRLEGALDRPVHAVVGHSLGGKVALAYAAKRPGALDSVWVIDSQPGVRSDPASSPTLHVLEMLESLPEAFADRAAFVRALQQHGLSAPIANWLAMSVRPGQGGYRLRLDLPAIRAILADYMGRDLWSEVERDDPRRELHFVVAGKSFVLGERDKARLRAIAERLPRVHVHAFEQAGHWVHVDAPEELHRLVVARL